MNADTELGLVTPLLVGVWMLMLLLGVPLLIVARQLQNWLYFGETEHEALG